MISSALSAVRPHERDAVRALLTAAHLPAADLGRVELYVARAGARVVGAIGLERYGTTGLLRSLIVDPDEQSHGIGGRLVAGLEAIAVAAGLVELVLLTTTAPGFFERLGYQRVDRKEVPGAVLGSEEFRSLCPASAICMSKELHPESNP